MSWNTIDWTALERLRTEYLSGSAGGLDYWHSQSDLASYDATFAQRIGWKWDYVLAELTQRGWVPPKCELLDWGCGSGIAGRAFLDHFGTQSVTGLRVWDRSPLAMQFAAKRAREKYSGLRVSAGMRDFPTARSPNSNSTREPLRNQPPVILGPPLGREDEGEGGSDHEVLLLSHVLNELDTNQTDALLDLAARVECLLWVEPGTHEVSRRLSVIREQLRERFNVIAPCTHSTACGMLVPGNDRHWCHHFAAPPREIFTDSNWSRFARLTAIDLRDLPLSFLVLDQRPAPSLPAGAGRIIGRPRIYKAHALLFGCDATGVQERTLNQRRLPAEFRKLKKSAVGGLCVWECAGNEVLAIKPLNKPIQ